MEDLSLQLRRAKRSEATKLELEYKDITTIPSEVFDIKSIEILSLSNNKITSLDSKLQNLVNLKFLDLSNNRLISVPSFLSKMPSL